MKNNLIPTKGIYQLYTVCHNFSLSEEKLCVVMLKFYILNNVTLCIFSNETVYINTNFGHSMLSQVFSIFGTLKKKFEVVY